MTGNPHESIFDLEELDRIIQVFGNQQKLLTDNKKALQDQISQTEQQLSEVEEKLKNVITFRDYVEQKGFGTIKQWIESHHEEILEAEKERISAEQNDNQEWDEDTIEFLKSQGYKFNSKSQ